MHTMLSEDQIEALTQELDAAIDTLDEDYAPVRVSRGDKGEDALVARLPTTQRTQLEQATEETAANFLQRFKRAARADICQEGGFIHDQWTRYEEIASKDLVKISAAVLTGMGMTSTASLLTTVVPVALWIVTALTHIGINALCDEA
jgi:hypothetical protein